MVEFNNAKKKKNWNIQIHLIINIYVVIVVLEINWHVITGSINNWKGNVTNGKLWLTMIKYYDISALMLMNGNGMEMNILDIMLLIKVEIYWRREKIDNK